MRLSPIYRLLYLVAFALSLAGCGAANSVPEATPTPAMPFSATSTRFILDPSQSTAQFSIDEILLGEPTTVTAVSSGVTGEIGVDFETPGKTAVGSIQVDTHQFLTDNDFRNRAIQRRILISDAYPFVTFTPTAVTGLPDRVTWGEPVPFQITGDLTIIGNTRPVTFAGTVLPVSESRLEGMAGATVLRKDFDLVVPSATGVAGVGEEVLLELTFVATAAE